VIIHVNGERREVVQDLSLSNLIDKLELPPQRIAVELNREVVRRAKWETTFLREDDRVEIVHFVGGG
jgi:sulfur carrier protein